MTLRALTLSALLLLVAGVARAAETTTVPAGVFGLDESYVVSHLDQRWDGARHAAPLIDDVRRYEPGGGLQGTLTARPTVEYRLLLSHLYYGITDHLMAAVAVPLVLQTTINTNLGWRSGDYQPQLGRAYSEDDFWAWAKSLGQSRPANTWQGNRNTFADMIVGARYRLPENPVLRATGIELAGSLYLALPTGHTPDPEELVVAGTTTWDLHSYGDAELHVSADRPFTLGFTTPRVNLGADLSYAYFRSRTYDTPHGTKYPLLMNYAPYVGEHYTLSPGNWQVATLSMEVSPILGPTRASMVSGNDLARAQALPALLTFGASYTHVHCQASTWKSDSAKWDYDREKAWGDGDKNALRGSINLSLLRLGLPLQLYALGRNQTLLPGKNTRAANTWSAGARLLLKFW